MGSERLTRPAGQKRALGVALGATLLLTVLVVGLTFANAVGAAQVADNAAALHWANATAGTSALTRAAIAQATTFAELEQAGLATTEDLDSAVQEARDSLAGLEDLERGGASSVSADELSVFLEATRGVMHDLDVGAVAEAKNMVMMDMESAYLDLTSSLDAEQADIQTRIEANTAGAARATALVRFFLTIAIPAAAVVIYRSIARRQVREMRLKIDVELEAQKAIGRAKDEFIAGLSHELKTPLTSIYGFAEIMSDGSEVDPAQMAEMSNIIANEASEMTRMVDDLLAAARLESSGLAVEPGETMVADVIESAVAPFEKAGLHVKRSGDDALVNTDAARLRHVLVNLLSNAATHGGSEVGIEVSTGEGVVDIEVWDNGSGVPDDRLENLFDTFIHNGAATLMTGTLGLGLGVASRITELLGGKLSYQRFLQKSYFTVTLPLAESHRAAEAEQPMALREVDREPMNVAQMIRALSA
jgi:signal transduction histidine kinase